MVLRRIFGPKRGDVRGEWGKLHNEEHIDLYYSPNLFGRSNEKDCDDEWGM
jgi:hypothetical protein